MVEFVALIAVVFTGDPVTASYHHPPSWLTRAYLGLLPWTLLCVRPRSPSSTRPARKGRHGLAFAGIWI